MEHAGVQLYLRWSARRIFHKVVEESLGLKRTTECSYNGVGFSQWTGAAGRTSVSLRYDAIGQLEEDSARIPPPQRYGAGLMTMDHLSVLRPHGALTGDSTISGAFIADVIERDVLGRVVAEKFARTMRKSQGSPNSETTITD